MRAFFLVLTVALAATLATCTASPAFAQDAPQTPNDKAVMAEAEFIEKMVEQAEGGGKGGEKGGEKPAPKPAAKKDEKKEEEAEGDEGGEAKGDEAEDQGAADDADAEGEPDEKDKKAADAEGEGAGDADETKEGDEADKGDKADDDGEDADGADGAEDAEGDDLDLADVDANAAPAPKLLDALKKHGAKAVLEDLPQGLRPIVEKRLKEMEAPYTRAMQEATGFRAERAKLIAEQQFAHDHPVDAMVEQLLADPTLGDKVNARLDEIGDSATNREAHAVVVKDKKAKALAAAEGETAKADRQAARTAEVEAYVRREAARRGIPLELGVEEAVALHILDRGDITREDIDRILREKKQQADRLLRGAKRKGRREYVDQKLQDRRTAGLKVKPNRGVAPAPPKAKIAQNDDEFLAEMDAKLAGAGM